MFESNAHIRIGDAFAPVIAWLVAVLQVLFLAGCGLILVKLILPAVFKRDWEALFSKTQRASGLKDLSIRVGGEM